MAAGKFSKPRPNREEEREIEQAFRQVTGQAPVPQPPQQAYEGADPADFNLVFDEEALIEDIPPEEPEAEESVDFVDKLMLLANRVMDFCNENRKIVLVSLCGAALALILSFIGIFFLGTSDPYDKTILNNVMIANINVGGMTKDEAISAVKNGTSHTYSAMDMVVDLAGTELRLSPKDTGASLDVKAAVNAAYDYGRTGTKAEREQAYLDSLVGSHIIGVLPYLDLDEDYIQKVLADCAEGTGSTLTQPSYGLDGGLPDLKAEDFDPNSKAPTLVITLGTPGIRFDVDTVYNQILDAYSLNTFLVTVEGLDTLSEPDPVDLQAVYDEFYVEPVNATVDLRTFQVIPGTYGCGFDIKAAQKLVDAAEYGEELRIPMEYIAPAVLNGDMFYQDTLAEYKTSYKKTISGLENNLALACTAINGTIINPGEEFSFNDIVGERTSARGYKYALDVTGLTEINLLGGGISQVSSALYYCALIADLNITNRTSHPLIPGYSDYGLDAMVGWKKPDFTFLNSTGFPIRIDAEASNGFVKVALIGTDERDYHSAMDYEITLTKAPKTEYQDYKADNEEGYKDGDVIREGVTGYTVKTYRLKYDNATGEMISRDFVANTTYQSVSKLVVRIEQEETKAPTKAPEETEEPTEETEEPTEEETEVPDDEEEVTPTTKPTEKPQKPTESPTEAPETQQPTETPTEAPKAPETTAATEPPVTQKEPDVTDAPEETGGTE